ncbi:hypothetical protein [Vibrio crassostreae]|uniref:hypothetical protein n=1 Tax=Vibrio crassostreae TaxID=246167 RepID=UPI000F49B77D|nr:hypothetical protein [Vibrio crassostreae]ROQ75556.1 hypothetical protein EDB72_3679 [Vibrio crassostreae]CAK3543062.1 conserved hypothetical protein [Vibrio crassostreae]
MKMILEMRYRREGKFFYNKEEICTLYQSDALDRILLRSPYLTSINNELFVYGHIKSSDEFEHLILALRASNDCYISFEDALSRWGVISQIPMMMILATTGASGWYSTPFGRFEFIHVEHSSKQIEEQTVDTGHPISIAKKEWAYKDLKEVKRNMHLIDYVELFTDDVNN